MTSEIPIEVFSNPRYDWVALNDPVMGGESTSSVEIDSDAGVGIFDGDVVDVPFLHAPGFIQMETRGGSFPDVSSCNGIQMVMKSTTPDYKGYRVSFGNVHVPDGGYARGYKANFNAPDGEGIVTIPFDEFTAKWSDGTGDAIVTCAENSLYCPDTDTLRSMETFAIWGEGVAGKVHLEIESISAVNCSDDNAKVEAANQVEQQKEAEAIVSTKVANENNEIVLENFADSYQLLTWKEMNDPVMGGQSTGTFIIDKETGTGHFQGEVKIVPFLKAPGFIQAIGDGRIFADVSSCSGIKLVIKTGNEKLYTGYRLGFGLKRPPNAFPYTHGFKSKFDVPPSGGEFIDIIIPFKDFSDEWDAGTGDITTTCAENSLYCPDEETLKNMKELTIWGEGVEGEVDLHIRSIVAVGCTNNIVEQEQSSPDNYLQWLSGQPAKQENGNGRMNQILIPTIIIAFVAVIALFGKKMIMKKKKNINYNQIENIDDGINSMPPLV